MIHMYIHIRKYRARNISMKKSFLFNISNKSFHDLVVYLVQQRKVLQHMFSFYLPETYIEAINH